MAYYIYILLCGDNTLYTGITTDLNKRLQQHRNGTGAKYTRGRSPLSLVYVDQAPDRSLASKEEARIKKLPRPEKNRLISQGNQDLLQKFHEKSS